MGEKDAQLLRTYWMALLTAIFLLVGGYFGYVFLTQEEKTLANDLTPLGYLGERIEHDLNSEPLLEISDELSIADTLKDGIDITFKNETTLVSEDETEELFLNFPRSLDEPMEITLPGGSFTVTHDTNQEYDVELLTGGTLPELIQDESLGSPASKLEETAKYVRYTSEDERVAVYYAYQKDQAEGYRNLKHWTLYNHGIGIESESYTFTNVTLKINDRGEVEGRFIPEQDTNTQGVDNDLWARAQRVIAQDLEQSTNPDFIIPPPYYLDQYGRQTTLEWALNNDADTISVAFNPLPGEYPVALDPTLQFTAPGVSNSGDVITGEATGNSFGYSLAAGDFNNDGKSDLVVGAIGAGAIGAEGVVYIFWSGSEASEATEADVQISGTESAEFIGSSLVVADFNGDGRDDLAVGAYGYGSSPGRTYVFYNGNISTGSASSANVIITGESGTNSYAGRAVTAGDWNADGIDDLAVGAYYYNTTYQGKVYVFYGGSLGASLTAGTDDDVTLTGEIPAIRFGFALSNGDLNSDGVDDLVVGAYGYFSNAGKVYIFYGDNLTDMGAGSADVVYTGEASGHNFGYSLSTDDFNSDGITDLAIGASGYTTLQGRVYIFHGGSIASSNASAADVIITGEKTSSIFGVSVQSGDVNSDGRADLIVGATGYDMISNEGRLYVFLNGSISTKNASSADVMITGQEAGNAFGSSLLSSDLNHDGENDLIVSSYQYNSSQGRAYIFYSQSGQVNLNDHITGEGTGDYFGSAFAVGDFNSDGRDDLAVGAYIDNSNTGSVYIFYNDGDYTDLASTSDVTITGAGVGDSFGWNLTAADLNSDGRTDLAVSSAAEAGGQGEVYIFYNDGAYPTTAASADVTISGESSSYFGWKLAVGDVDDDGADDLIVGAATYNSNAGRVYVFYNDGSYVSTAANADVVITGESSSWFGQGLAVGDLNADGSNDLVIGAPLNSSSKGKVYAFWGPITASSTATSADAIITNTLSSVGMGAAIAISDTNADGTNDLLISDNSDGFPRSLRIFYGGTTFASSTQNDADHSITTWGSGSHIGTGDYNNDGRNDIAIGQRLYNTDSQGLVSIFFNDGSYPTSFTDADISINGDSANDDFGYALATGDFNADGKDDLVIGAPGYDNGGDTGRVYFYETREDYAWEIQRQSLQDGLRVDPLMGYEMKITGEQTSTRFTSSIAMADLNNDGKDDLIVGGTHYDDQRGKVYIFYNSGNYPTRAGRADVTITGESTYTQFGDALGVGDFNNDGIDDFVVSATGYVSGTGRAYIFYGGGTISNSSASADVLITGESTFDSFGSSFATGDYNGDGTDDLAVGSHVYGAGNDGRVYIFYNDGSIPTTASSADVYIAGEGSGDYFGASLTTGDFNDDGTDDLAVGAWFYNSSQGRVYIYHGGSLGALLEAATSSDTIITGESTGDRFGALLTTGDYNNDGKDDLASGAYWYNTNQGRVYLYYGGSLGASLEAATSSDVIYTGESTDQTFGYGLSTGDFNKDGRDDLAVGDVGYDVGTDTNEGRVYLFYSTSSPGSRNASAADVTLTGESAGDAYGVTLFAGDLNNDGTDDLMVGSETSNNYQGRLYFYTTNDRHITGEGTDEFFGSSFAVGDYNNDGKNDLAVGAKGWNDNDTGRVYIFYGGQIASTSVTGANVVLTGESTSDRFGISLVSGDFNQDGTDDLVVGANTYATDQGRAYIFHGGSIVTENASNADVILTGESSVSARFGKELAVGDFNADGVSDLVVDSWTYNSGQGRAYIFYGGSMISENASNADVIYTGEDTGQYFSSSFSVGDFNADGVDDLGVGSYTYNTDVGRIYVFYGGAMSSSSASAADVICTGEAETFFGAAQAAGDLNRDGTDDLIVGGYKYGSYAGRVYVFYGGSLSSSSAAAADVKLDGENTSNNFGLSLYTGDLNADGTDDLVAGAPRWNNDYTGRVYVFYGGELQTTGAEHANIIVTGEAVNSDFGDALYTDDLTGNGVDDLIIGALNYDDPNDQGRIYIIMSEAAAEHRSSYKIRGDVKIRGTVKFH